MNRNVTKNGLDRVVWLIEPAIKLLRSWHAHPDRIKSPYLWGTLYKPGYDFGWAPKIDNYHGVCYVGARREAGILRRVTFHHLRDTYASHLLSGTFGRSWDIAEVAAQLGHSSTYVTERYAGMIDDAMERAAAATDGYGLTIGGIASQPAAAIETWHDTWHADFSQEAQVLDFIGHAQRDSNSRHSDPKSDALSS